MIGNHHEAFSLTPSDLRQAQYLVLSDYLQKLSNYGNFTASSTTKEESHFDHDLPKFVKISFQHLAIL